MVFGPIAASESDVAVIIDKMLLPNWLKSVEKRFCKRHVGSIETVCGRCDSTSVCPGHLKLLEIDVSM